MIDLHCHLLAGIDDGPQTLEEAVALACACVAAGVDTVAATPHVNSRFPNDPATISAALQALRQALADAALPLEVLAGAEIALHHGLELDDPTLRSLGLGGGPWLLIEAPHAMYPRVDVAIRELLVRGHHVLLAHPERSPTFLRDPASLESLVGAGVRTQVTASALTGRFGRTVQRQALRWTKAGLVHVIASDAHDQAGRPPGLRRDIDQAGLAGQAARLTELAPRAILAGEELPDVTVSHQATDGPRRRLLAGLLRR